MAQSYASTALSPLSASITASTRHAESPGSTSRRGMTLASHWRGRQNASMRIRQAIFGAIFAASAFVGFQCFSEFAVADQVRVSAVDALRACVTLGTIKLTAPGAGVESKRRREIGQATTDCIDREISKALNATKSEPYLHTAVRAYYAASRRYFRFLASQTSARAADESRLMAHLREQETALQLVMGGAAPFYEQPLQVQKIEIAPSSTRCDPMPMVDLQTNTTTIAPCRTP